MQSGKAGSFLLHPSLPFDSTTPPLIDTMPSTVATTITFIPPLSDHQRIPSVPLEEDNQQATVIRIRSRRRIGARIGLIMNLILLSSIRTTLASVRCFNTEAGNSLTGADYHRTRGVDHRGCAMECRDDPSCLAYEWHAKTETCYLKSRSLSSSLGKKEDAVVGFCLDEDDEIRDRFYDHEIEGPVVHEETGVEGDECRGLCMTKEKSIIYSWSPAEPENDESTVGLCRCIESIRSIKLTFNTFSGFLPQRRHKFRM